MEGPEDFLSHLSYVLSFLQDQGFHSAAAALSDELSNRRSASETDEGRELLQSPSFSAPSVLDGDGAASSSHIEIPDSSAEVLEQEERKDDRDSHFLDSAQPARDLEAQQHAQFVGSSRKLLASNSILSRAWEVEFDEYDNPDDVGYLRKDVGAQQSFAECEIDAISEEGSERYFMHQPGDLNYDDVESEGGDTTPTSPLGPAPGNATNYNNGVTSSGASSGIHSSLLHPRSAALDTHSVTPTRTVVVASSTGMSNDASPSTSALSSPVGGGSSGPTKSRKQQLLFGGGVGRRNTASALGTNRDGTGARLVLAINKLPSADATWDAGPTDIKFGVPVITPSKGHDHSEPRPVLSRVESLSSSFKDFELERMGHDEDGGTTSRSQNNGLSSEAGYDSEAEVIDFQVSGSNLADGGYRDQDLSAFFIPNSHSCTRASSITSNGLEGYHIAGGSGSALPALTLDSDFVLPELLAGEAADFNLSLSAAPTANRSTSAYSTSSANLSSSSGVHPWPLGYATAGGMGSRGGSGEGSPAAANDGCSARVTWCGVGAVTASAVGVPSAAQQDRKSDSGEASSPTLAARAMSGGQLFDGASIFSGHSLLTGTRGSSLPTSSSSVPTTPKLSLPAFMIGAGSPAIHSARAAGPWARQSDSTFPHLSPLHNSSGSAFIGIGGGGGFSFPVTPVAADEPVQAKPFTSWPSVRSSCTSELHATSDDEGSTLQEYNDDDYSRSKLSSRSPSQGAELSQQLCSADDIIFQVGNISLETLHLLPVVPLTVPSLAHHRSSFGNDTSTPALSPGETPQDNGRHSISSSLEVHTGSRPLATISTATPPHTAGDSDTSQAPAAAANAAAAAEIPAASAVLPSALADSAPVSAAAVEVSTGTGSRVEAGTDVDWSVHPPRVSSPSPSPFTISAQSSPAAVPSCIEQLELDLEAISVAHSLADLLLDSQPAAVAVAGAAFSDPQEQPPAPASLGRREDGSVMAHQIKVSVDDLPELEFDPSLSHPSGSSSTSTPAEAAATAAAATGSDSSTPQAPVSPAVPTSSCSPTQPSPPSQHSNKTDNGNSSPLAPPSPTTIPPSESAPTIASETLAAVLNASASPSLLILNTLVPAASLSSGQHSVNEPSDTSSPLNSPCPSQTLLARGFSNSFEQQHPHNNGDSKPRHEYHPREDPEPYIEDDTMDDTVISGTREWARKLGLTEEQIEGLDLESAAQERAIMMQLKRQQQLLQRQLRTLEAGAGLRPALDEGMEDEGTEGEGVASELDLDGEEEYSGSHFSERLREARQQMEEGADDDEDGDDGDHEEGEEGDGGSERGQTEAAVAAAAAAAAAVAAAGPTPRYSLDDNGSIVYEYDQQYIDSKYEVFDLRVIHRRQRTGFEETKDFPIRQNDLIAGRYQVMDFLGSAAFSRAVQALDVKTGTLVCLKIIKNNKDYFDQSLDEIKLLQYVNRRDPADEHGLVRLFDFFYYKEHLFLVCELLRANLYEFQKYNKESGDELYFTNARIQRIATQVLRSLAFIHSLGLVHSDLKPENILIKSYSRCEVKVIDLGSSCFITDQLSSYVQSRSYRAPEVILGLPYDHKIDVWSLGCILAELSSGYVLFQNDSLATLLARLEGILGPLPPWMLARGRYSSRFYTRSGTLYEKSAATEHYELLYPKHSSLRHRIPDADPGLLDFIRCLLTVDPRKRPTPAQALNHPWLQAVYPRLDGPIDE